VNPHFRLRLEAQIGYCSFMLTVTDLWKSYQMGDSRLEILTGVNLVVKKGEFVSVLGASGTGKSTLLHLLGGLDRPDRGMIEIGGNPILAASDREMAQRRNQWIGFVFQFHHLLPEFTALENAAIPLRIRGLAPAEACSEAERCLVEVGLGERLYHLPTQLSGGERQRVAFARALVTSPELLLMDEPTGNLDPHTGDGLFNTVTDLQKSKQLTVIMVTHNMDLANQTDRKLLMREGKLVPLEG
jgi:lipoprotein-releasing system ATP-binding protein